MKFLRAFFYGLFLCFVKLSFAAAPPTIIPSAPELASKAYLLMDYRSERILVGHNVHDRVEPASLTKMMTMYVIDQELKAQKLQLDDEILISEHAWRTSGSRMFVQAGAKVKAADLIRGIIIQSGNDASSAMAESIAGTEEAFVSLMNHYAKALGMNETHFVNPTGMPDPDHYTSAYDMAILAKALIRDFPESYKIYSEKWFSYKGIKQPNRNRLLWQEPYVDGIKTGHSDSAGFCLAASGEKDGMRLISIVMGSQSDNARTEQSQKLLRYGFRFFETRQLFTAQTVLNEPRIWMGSKKKLSLGIKEDLYVTIPQGQYEKLEALMKINQEITAPIQAGATYGQVEVKLGEDLILSKPLVALDAIEKAGAWRRLTDYVSLSIHRLFNKKES